MDRAGIKLEIKPLLGREEKEKKKLNTEINACI
jgi:hypothetical protein